MKPEIPPWSYPLLLGLLGLVLFFGDFSLVWRAAIGGESLLFLVYLVLRARSTDRGSRGAAKVLSLFPGHLLLLFAVGFLSPPPVLLLALWMAIPAASVLYDVVGRTERFRGQESILTGLYCIIWADLFFVLERVISLGRGLSREDELIVAAVFVVVGVPFLWVGAYRHLRMKIDKE